jgi:hypothetical protein
MKVRIALPLAFFGGLALTAPAAAIVANPQARVCTAMSRADLVVAAKLGKRRLIADGEYVAWTVKPSRVYKGKAPSRLVVVTPNTSARAPLDDGQSAVLFIHRQKGRFTIWGSDPNDSGKSAMVIGREVKELSRRAKGKTGSVKVLVADENGAPGANLTVHFARHNSSVVRTAKTDRNGLVAIGLPPGKWTAKVVDPSWSSDGSTYGYDNPDGFDLEAGGCADLRLKPVSAKRNM